MVNDREGGEPAPRTATRPLAIRLWLPWLVALVLFITTTQTAPEILDFDAVEGGVLAVVAAAAALPFGLIGTRLLPLAWLVSAGSAFLISRTVPVIDGDPWPWPIEHGLVLLALVFAVALRPPADLHRAQQAASVAIVWFFTAALFAASVPERLQAGWVVAVTATVVAGVALRWLGWLGPSGDGTRNRTSNKTWLPDAWRTEALGGFREAFVSWVRSPPTRPPLGRGLLERLQRRAAGFPLATWLPAVAPWMLAFGVFWIGVASIRETLDVHDLALPFYAALIALPIGLARTHALLGWRLATVLAIVVALVGTPHPDGLDPGTWPVIQQWVWLIATFVATVRHRRSTALWIWAASVAVMSAGAGDNPGVAVTLIVAASALVLIADLVRARRTAKHDLERQTELSELEKARRTVLEERTRIARDLHDVVAHHMSMVVVQAETAPYRLPDLPESARAEFAAVSATARQALNEIRGMLGVLRSDDQGLLTAPQPGLGHLQDLVASVKRSGVPVTLAISGVPAALGTTADLSAYRIVQESLANAARHAPGASVSVHVHYGDHNVRLRITNEPAGAPASPGPPGHGIIGMRERAMVAGGSLRAGALDTGGFEVEATMPVNAEETQP